MCRALGVSALQSGDLLVLLENASGAKALQGFGVHWIARWLVLFHQALRQEARRDHLLLEGTAAASLEVPPKLQKRLEMVAFLPLSSSGVEKGVGLATLHGGHVFFPLEDRVFRNTESNAAFQVNCEV